VALAIQPGLKVPLRALAIGTRTHIDVEPAVTWFSENKQKIQRKIENTSLAPVLEPPTFYFMSSTPNTT